MTWKEIKNEIEAQGVTDEMDCFFIDIHCPDEVYVGLEREENQNDIGFIVTT